MKKTSQRSHGTMSELNITPLLDLVFVLLVIFIITTPQMINSLEMHLPSGKVPPPPKTDQPPPKINHVDVDAEGHVKLNGESIPDSELKARFAAVQAADPDPRFVVDGDNDAEYGNVVKVLDPLRQLNITKVGLATQ